MKISLLAVLCLALVSFASAQGEKPAASKFGHSSHASSSALEAKVKKSWEDYKNKNEKDFSAGLAKGFSEVEDDGEGLRDAKAEITEMGQLDLKEYKLKDMKVKPLGADAALITYVSEYKGSSGGQAVQEKDAVAEVWIKEGGAWKALYVQNSKVK